MVPVLRAWICVWLLLAVSILLAAAPVGAQPGPTETFDRRAAQSKAALEASRLDEAFRLAEVNVAEAERALGPDHPAMAGFANDLARAAEALNRLDLAETNYRRAVALAEAKLPADHIDRAVFRNNLGQLQRVRGRLGEAKATFDAALETARRIAGDRNLITGIILNNRAETDRLLDDMPAAEKGFREALAILEAAGEPAAIRVPVLLNNIASLVERQGRFEEAEALYRRSIAAAEARRPVNLPLLVGARYNLSGVYLALSRFREAETEVRAAITASEGLGRGEGQDIALMLVRLGRIFIAEGRVNDADALFTRALAMGERVLGQDNIALVSILLPMAEVMTRMGRAVEAVVLADRALTISTANLGAESVQLAPVLHHRGNASSALGRFPDAEADLARGVTLSERGNGPDHPLTLTLRNDLADVLAAQSRYTEAAVLMEQVLQSRRRTQAPNRIELAIAAHNLAKTYLNLGRFPEALPLLVSAMQIAQANPSVDPAVARTLYLTAATAAEAIGMKDEAAEFRSFAAAVPGIDELEVVIMYATNRAIDPRRTAKDVHPFADTGAADPSKVITGSAFVRAPKTEVVNRAGRLAETTGRLDRAAGRQTEETALRLRDIGMVEGDDGRQLAEAATKRLGRSARFPNQMLLYVHGYNNSFTEAMLRTAMIGYDLDFDGPLMSFSWPSRSGPTTYFGDRERAAQSAPFLVAFLERVFKHLPDVKLHVVGHSTGAEVVLAALDGLAARRAAGATSSNFGEIIFAHADVAPPRLAQSQAALAALGVRITSYSSKEDWAMSLSDWVRFKGARVGGAPVYLPQVDAIDITGLGARFALNHTVFVRNPMVFGDMARLMATGQRPPHARTPALSETRTAQGLHWEFKQR